MSVKNIISLLSRHTLMAIVTMTMIGAVVSSCENDPASEPDNVDFPMTPKVELTLNLGILKGSLGSPANGHSLGSRSSETPEDGDFQLPEYVYENIRFLRVVIVRQSGIVEYNTVLPFVGQTEILQYRFKVIGGEKKTIYLFGNETPEFTAQANDKIVKGGQFPETWAKDFVLTRPSGAPLFDNSTPAIAQYLPMSEVFEVDVIGNDSPVLEQTENLFVTRAVTKFTFNIKAGEYYAPDGAFEIQDISFSGLAESEYYLPRAEYSPTKYESGINPYGGRYITEFQTPQTEVSTYYFSPSIPLTVKYNEPAYYHPKKYFTETEMPEGGFKIAIKIKDADETEGTWLEAKVLEDLDNLPRNTHVYVNITVTNSKLDINVTIEPFKSVELNPGFGFK